MLVTAWVFVAWGTLNSRQAACPLVKLVEGEEKWEAPDHTLRVVSFLENLGGIGPNLTHLHGAQSYG
ncbi:hypothetical protein TNCV_3726031 [Trichonephila clavipes]|nr:hypothetical protein TNCV_3726031 [Trichonephila clavipes]